MESNQSQGARGKNPLLVKFAEESSRRRFYSPFDLLAARRALVFYFYPSESAQDVDQYALVAHSPGVFAFPIQEDVHGVPLLRFSVRATLDLSGDRLREIHARCPTLGVSRQRYSLMSSGFAKTAVLLGGMKLRALTSQAWAKRQGARITGSALAKDDR